MPRPSLAPYSRAIWMAVPEPQVGSRTLECSSHRAEKRYLRTSWGFSLAWKRLVVGLENMFEMFLRTGLRLRVHSRAYSPTFLIPHIVSAIMPLLSDLCQMKGWRCTDQPAFSNCSRVQASKRNESQQTQWALEETSASCLARNPRTSVL